jgi:hypothetical protein
MMGDIENHEDQISVEDITDRVDDLKGERESLADAVEDAETDMTFASHGDGDETGELAETLATAKQALADWDASDDAAELKLLSGLLDQMKGYGGNHQWEGDWYPDYLIRRSYFVDYVEELVKDIGDMPDHVASYIAIDWQKTADNVEQDYSTIDYDGVEYLYR